MKNTSESGGEICICPSVCCVNQGIPKHLLFIFVMQFLSKIMFLHSHLNVITSSQ